MTTAHHERSAIGAMYAGLGLTVAAVIVLYVDHATGNVLAGHIRAGYPSYGQVRIDSAVTTYLIYLSALGALGVLSWLCTIWAASTLHHLGREHEEAVGALGRDGAVRGRHEHRLVRPARQRHLR